VWDIEATGVDEDDCGADCDMTLLPYPMKDQSKSSSDVLSANDGECGGGSMDKEIWRLP
jgi:hypothetical protein